MAQCSKLLYVYRCGQCLHRGDQRLDGDSDDGEETICASCGGPMTLEWDRGVVLETPKTIAGEMIARARDRK